MTIEKSCFHTLLSTLLIGISLTLTAIAGFATKNRLELVPFLFVIINFCSYLFFKANQHKFPYYFHIGLLFLIANNSANGSLSFRKILYAGMALTILFACIMAGYRHIKGRTFFNQKSYADYLCEKYQALFHRDERILLRSVVHSGILFLLAWVSYLVYGHRGYWLLISGSAVLIGEELEDIHVRGIKRILGAVAGFLIAGIFVMAGISKTGLIFLYIAALIGAILLMPHKYILGSACIGLQATSANAFMEGKMGYTIILERAGWTIIGALVAIALCYIADRIFKNLYYSHKKHIQFFTNE